MDSQGTPLLQFREKDVVGDCVKGFADVQV